MKILKCHYYGAMDGCFKKTLREELDFQNVTVKELSARTGIPKPTIDCYLSTRKVMPPADVAVRIAQALQVSVEYLVTGADAKLHPKEHEDYQHFRFVLADLAKLKDAQLETVSVMIHALAEKSEG